MLKYKGIYSIERLYLMLTAQGDRWHYGAQRLVVLNEALQAAAQITFSRISKYEEERNGCTMSVEEVVKSLKAQASSELTK